MPTMRRGGQHHGHCTVCRWYRSTAGLVSWCGRWMRSSSSPHRTWEDDVGVQIWESSAHIGGTTKVRSVRSEDVGWMRYCERLLSQLHGQGFCEMDRVLQGVPCSAYAQRYPTSGQSVHVSTRS
jgi:hypothetical protein